MFEDTFTRNLFVAGLSFHGGPTKTENQSVKKETIFHAKLVVFLLKSAESKKHSKFIEEQSSTFSDVPMCVLKQARIVDIVSPS